ncbi:agmatine deiminase family protein [Pseudomarimonas salicorniae]|uniref:Agmatine deiminase family protein n=1 Tax=Pseudomarimonas salicorniae TaxID=2933270 RepID=A0ABT0GF46_9GAMM|nr:agmatine deiminase family protein [Lysobacter sp. CAU 1642]
MSAAERRFPAEWEPQDAVLIAWPHDGTDWAERLAEVESSYVALGTAVTRFQPLVICCRDGQLVERARGLLTTAGADPQRLRFVEIDYDDTWLRDSGPISLLSKDGPVLLDFRFTGWGGKFEAGRDDALIAGLIERGVFASSCRHEPVDFILEGGGIETDGRGTLLSTWACLAQRHPDKSRDEVAGVLLQRLVQDRVLILDHGYLEGDDTDAHIDTLARFASPTRIVYQGCDDPADSHFDPLGRMAEELASLRQANGQSFELFALPWAQPVIDEGRRLAASYANFLIINGAVLMPAYGDPADARAAAVLARAFPDRQIVPVPCRPLIWQNGSLHCVTMQLPQGVLAA